MGPDPRLPEERDEPKSAESVSKMATLITSPTEIFCGCSLGKFSKPRDAKSWSEGLPEAERCKLLRGWLLITDKFWEFNGTSS